MHDVIVVGGGFAGVTAAREVALTGQRVLLVEARNRLGGRTWTDRWEGLDIERGGAWVHWHQPHTWSELTRAGLAVELSGRADEAAWYVGDDRRSGSIEERDAIAERGWDRFVDGVEEALPNPHDPLLAPAALDRFDRQSIAERMAELELDDEEHAVLWAELESLASGPLEESGALSVLRWHALSGGSLALTQYTGGRVTIREGTGALVHAIADEAPFERRLEAPVAAVAQRGDGVEVHLRRGDVLPARAVVMAVPLNVLPAIEFRPSLSELKQEGIAYGQASRGSKVFIRARGAGDRVLNAIRPLHAFGYIDTEYLLGEEQVLIGFGYDQTLVDAGDLPSVQADLDTIMPGLTAVAATAHDWLADEFARGTWAIHRPGWYTRFHAELQRPEGRVVLAGSDLADGWAGFMDGAIESGLRAGRTAVKLARG